MEVNSYAEKLAETAILVNVPKLVMAYFIEVSDPMVPEQQVMFVTSGYRGSACKKAFNECHILTISQAISQ